jgi:hypothetical protein
MAKTKKSVTVAGKTSSRASETPYTHVVAVVSTCKWLSGREFQLGTVISWHHSYELAEAQLNRMCVKSKSQVDIIVNRDSVQILPVNE